MSNLMMTKELGKYLKLSDSTIYKLASSGELPEFKIGDSWRFDMEEVLKVITRSRSSKPFKSPRGQKTG